MASVLDPGIWKIYDIASESASAGLEGIGRGMQQGAQMRQRQEQIDIQKEAEKRRQAEFDWRVAVNKKQNEIQKEKNAANMVFGLMKNDPEAATKMWNETLGPKYGTVEFKGQQGDYSFYESDEGIQYYDKKNPQAGIQTLPGKGGVGLAPGKKSTKSSKNWAYGGPEVIFNTKTGEFKRVPEPLDPEEEESLRKKKSVLEGNKNLLSAKGKKTLKDINKKLGINEEEKKQADPLGFLGD